MRVPADWLNRAAEGLERLQCDYVGGRVLPIWGAPRPAWIPNHGGKQWAVIALLDYGPQPIEFGARVPLGVNMAFRRDAFERAGLFDPHTGRRAGTLLGQEVREWCIRARKAGVRGYLRSGDGRCEHIIPADRLCKTYFRRWFYWRGISRALLYERAGLDMEAPEQTRLDFSKVPHVAGVPRYLYRKAARARCGGWLRVDDSTRCDCGIRPRGVALVLRRNRQAALARLPHAVDSEGGPRQVVPHPRVCRVQDRSPPHVQKRRDRVIARRRDLALWSTEPEAICSGRGLAHPAFTGVLMRWDPHQSGAGWHDRRFFPGNNAQTPPPTITTRRPAVSVIMPAFNVEPFIGGAIDSVRSQTFSDFELLVVDDGSTDWNCGGR